MILSEKRKHNSEMSVWYYNAVKECYRKNDQAKPCIYYHMGSFYFSPGLDQDGKPLPFKDERATILINAETFHEFIYQYKREVSIYLINEILNDFLTEKEIFGLL